MGDYVVTISSDSGLLNSGSVVTVDARNIESNFPAGRLIVAESTRVAADEPNTVKLHLVQLFNGQAGPLSAEADLTLNLTTVIENPLTVVPQGTGHLNVVKNLGRRLQPFYALSECVGSL